MFLSSQNMAVTLKCVLVLCLVTPSTQLKKYENFRVVTVRPESVADLELLSQLQTHYVNTVTFWADPIHLGRNVTLSMDEGTYIEVVPQLQGAGLNPSLVTSDLQSMIDVERSGQTVPAARTGGASGSINLLQFNRHQDINDWLDYLAETCDYCSVFSIGLSYEGRDMKVIKLSKGDGAKPAIWIDAGIHAREWIAPATALYLIDKLVLSAATSGRYYQSPLKDFDWYILPSVNPDGYEYTWDVDRLWRKTRQPTSDPWCAGVDPNRNWDFHWMETGASSSPCSEIYAGPNAFSEPETQNVANFLLDNSAELLVYLTIHSYGQYWLTPWGYTSDLPSDYDDLEGVATKATNTIQSIYGRHYTVGSSTNVLYAAAGGSDDWAKGGAGIKYSYTVELRDEGWNGFILPQSEIDPQGVEMWAAVRTMASEVHKREGL